MVRRSQSVDMFPSIDEPGKILRLCAIVGELELEGISKLVQRSLDAKISKHFLLL